MNRTERARINRENASKSTGPKTEEGKDASRRNALKHGLRAEAITLPTEDAAAVQAALDHWEDAYGPETPGEQALVERAAYATIQMRRCARLQTAVVAKQVRSAAERWDAEREEDVARHAALLKDDPAALRGLRRTADGCRWLFEKWDYLQYRIEHVSAVLAPADRDLAIRLQGWKAEDFRTDTNVYWFRLINLLSAEEPDASAVEWLSDRKQRPDPLRATLAGGLPTLGHSRDEIARTVREHLDELSARAERLGRAIDAPDRAEAADRALLPDGPSGALLARYEKMHESAFHRAYKGILQAQKEADARAEDSAPAAAPNEAKSAAKPSSKPCFYETYDTLEEFVAALEPASEPTTLAFPIVPAAPIAPPRAT